MTWLKDYFFELSLDLMCILDVNGCIHIANPAFERTLGNRIDHLVGQPLASLIYPGDQQGFYNFWSQLRRVENTPKSFMCRILSSDSTTKWYIWTVYPHTLDLFYTIGKDITPYREMENRESERNAFAEALLDTVLAINSSLSLDQVLNRVLSNVGKVVAYDHMQIMLIEGDFAEVVGVHLSGQQVDVRTLLERRTFRISQNDYLNTMYQSKESLIVSNVHGSSEWMLSTNQSVSGSFLGAPIVVEDEVIGLLNVFHAEYEYFTSIHAQQLITFANQAGIAIKNARLYEQAESVAVLKERQRMAQELHDSVNQNLFAASTYADLLPKAIQRKPEVVERYANDINRLIRSAVAQMRMILIELHPDTLIKTDLNVLLKQQCDAFRSQTGISVQFRASSSIVLPPDDQIAIYRILQEALHNIEKHARATAVTVDLSIVGTELLLSISDNGQGFDPGVVDELHFGVRGMYDRADHIKAELDLISTAGQGTKIIIRKKISC